MVARAATPNATGQMGALTSVMPQKSEVVPAIHATVDICLVRSTAVCLPGSVGGGG